MKKIKWTKTRNDYVQKNTYMTAEPIDGKYYMTTNDTPNGAWNFGVWNTDTKELETDVFFHTLREVKKFVENL